MFATKKDKKCKICHAYLMGAEKLGRICNKCLDAAVAKGAAK